MRWTIFPDHEAASHAVASRLLAFVRAKPAATLALPSGNTPTRIYELLAKDKVDFSTVNVFALDEYLGLGPEDPRSFAAFFRDRVFAPLGLAAARTHCLQGLAESGTAEALRYEALILGAGGLDLTLLGLGANGHIAFNEPGEVLFARTHVTDLAPPASDVAPRGITMGIGTLLSAPVVLLIATGAKKAEAVRNMLSGRVDPRCPASLLQAHPGVEVFLDTAAAAGL